MSAQTGNNFKMGVVVGFLSLSLILFCITLLTHSWQYYYRYNSESAATPSSSSDSIIQTSSFREKKPLLAVVVSSLKDRKSLSLLIRKTWARSSRNGRFDHVIVTASSDFNESEVPAHVAELDHEDFTSYTPLSHEELTFVLSKVRELYLSGYWWFLLVPSNTYVSYEYVNRVTQGIDPRDAVYMGRPARDEHYCQSGPGILISYGLLLRIGQDVEKCVMEQSNKTSSDVAFGSCLHLLFQINCSSGNENLEKLFVSNAREQTKSLDYLWEDGSYQSMATFFPIHDHDQLEAVHAWSQVREISHYQKEAIRSLGMLRKNQMCSSSVPECGLRQDGQLLSSITRKDLTTNCALFTKDGHKPESLRQLDTWDVIVAGNLYSGKSVDPSSSMDQWLAEMVNYTTAVATEIARARSPSLELAQVGTCYTRHKAMQGQEFIYDLELVDREKKTSIIKKRVAFRLPFRQKFMWLRNTKVVKNLNDTVVNIVVPLDATVEGGKVVYFMRNYHRLCVWLGGGCRIIFIVFDNGDKESFHQLKGKVTSLSRKYPYLIRHVVYFTDSYEKSKRYNSGMWLLTDNELAVLGDVDVSMNKEFIDRCRQYATRGRQVYFPKAFQYYNMKYVYNSTWHPRKPSLSRKHGHWVKGSTVCLYKSDYNALGEYQEIYKWAWQTVFKKNGLTVIQSPDPGLTRMFTEFFCSKKLPKRKRRKCLRENSEHFGDRATLAHYAIALKESCSHQKKRG